MRTESGRAAARRTWKSARIARMSGLLAAVLLALAPAAPAGATLEPSPAPTAGVPAGGETVGGDALASAGLVVGAGVTPPPVVDATSYVVADLGSGDVLAAKAAHSPQLPASTLKVLTALTLLPELDKAQIVAGTPEAAAVDGSKAGIEPGLQYSIDLVFKAMMMQSGNDAAVTLALAAGGVAETVADMNEVARDLNALDTVAVNTSGLDAPGQVTSAYDLALITREALQRDDFRTYITTRTADMPNRDGGTYQIQNENRFVATYDGAIGVKNGYTTLARHTFVGAAERGGRTLVVTVMRTEGRPEPVVAALMDWGFANAATAVPVGELVPRGQLAPSSPAATPPQHAPTTNPPDQAAADAVGPTPVAAVTATDDGGSDGWVTVGVIALALLATVVALRARVLWRQRAWRAR